MIEVVNPHFSPLFVMRGFNGMSPDLTREHAIAPPQ
jgi:hypothetical protein